MFSPVCMPLWGCQILELQTVLSCRVGAGNPGSSGRAVNILNHWAISLAPKYLTFNILRLISVLPHDDDCKNYPYLLETLSVDTALSSCESNLNPVLHFCVCPCQSHGVDVSVMASRLVVLGQISLIWHWLQFLQIWFLLNSEKERISLSRDDPPNCYLMTCGQPWNHTHTSNTKYSHCIVLICYICILVKNGATI